MLRLLVLDMYRLDAVPRFHTPSAFLDVAPGGPGLGWALDGTAGLFCRHMLVIIGDGDPWL